MKYSSLLFVAVVAVTASYTQAVSKSVDAKTLSSAGFSDLKLSISSDAQNVKESENKSPRKPKKFKKKSHAYNKKRGKRK
jgi:hypothetical protein